MDDITRQLIDACENSEYDKAVEAIKNGADVNYNGINPDVPDLVLNPLILSCSHGSYELVQHLIEGGADVNVRIPMHGSTPLIWASGRGHLRIVQYLLDHGADYDMEYDSKNKIKSYSSATNNALASAAYGGHPSVVELLLERGALIDDDCARYIKQHKNSWPDYLARYSNQIKNKNLISTKSEEISKNTKTIKSKKNNK